MFSTYFNLKQCGRPVEIRRSATGRGNHFLARGLQMSYEDALKVRAYLGECPTRLRFDSDTRSHKPKAILWREKIIGGKVYKMQVLTEEDLLRLPFWSRPPQAMMKEKSRRRDN